MTRDGYGNTETAFVHLGIIHAGKGCQELSTSRQQFPDPTLSREWELLVNTLKARKYGTH